MNQPNDHQPTTINESPFSAMSHEPDPLNLLRCAPEVEWTPEEIKRFTEELSIAYHTDEATSNSRDVQRISEKVRLRLDKLMGSV
jgi:tRNA(Ile)-lysidine synthase TilS/MesJ